MKNRVKKTRVIKKGNGFQINFSEKDGKALAEQINRGKSILGIEEKVK